MPTTPAKSIASATYTHTVCSVHVREVHTPPKVQSRHKSGVVHAHSFLDDRNDHCARVEGQNTENVLLARCDLGFGDVWFKLSCIERTRTRFSGRRPDLTWLFCRHRTVDARHGRFGAGTSSFA